MARGTGKEYGWARLGAAVRLAALNKERAAILKAFPDLNRKGAAEVMAAPKPSRTISAEGRKAMSEGMRKYWARRKAQGKGSKRPTTSHS